MNPFFNVARALYFISLIACGIIVGNVALKLNYDQKIVNFIQGEKQTSHPQPPTAQEKRRMDMYEDHLRTLSADQLRLRLTTERGVWLSLVKCEVENRRINKNDR